MPKDHQRNTSAMLEAQKKRTEEKLLTLQTVLSDMIANKETIVISRICLLTGLSKNFLYSNEKAKELISNAKNKSQLKSVTKALDYDLVLQYEEVKRKLHESYILQTQLLSFENERLKKEISILEMQVDHLKSSPKCSVHFKAGDSLKNEFFTFHVESIRGNKIFNPVGETIIENLLWDDYIITSSNLKFELENKIDGIIFEKVSDGYLLSISNSVKKPVIITIIIKEKADPN